VIGCLLTSNSGPTPPKKVKVPPKLPTDVSRRSDSRMRPPHFQVCRPPMLVEVFVRSQLFVVVEELPICGPSDWNAPCTISAGVVLFAMSFTVRIKAFSLMERCSASKPKEAFDLKSGPLMLSPKKRC